MTTGDNEATAAYGQPTGFPQPTGDDEATAVYGQPTGFPQQTGTPVEPPAGGYEPPSTGYEAPGGYPPPPSVGYSPTGYPTPPPAGYPPPAPGYYPPPAPGYTPPATGPTPPGFGPVPGTGYPPPPNPYGAPVGGYYPGGPPMGWGQPGDLMTRFFARLIDGIGVWVISMVFSFILAAAFDGRAGWMIAGIFSGLLAFGYYVLFETQQGRTPGKALLGLRVHGPGGAPKPTMEQSAKRNAFLLVGLIPFVGWLLSFAAWIYIAVTIENSPTKQGKHDEIAGGTQVVKV